MITKIDLFPQELSDKEIAESIDLRSELSEELEVINGFTFISQVRAYRGTLPRVALTKRLSSDEANILINRLDAKQEELIAGDVGSVAMADEIQAEQSPWTPSNVLTKVPNTVRDWAERAANDRKEKDN